MKARRKEVLCLGRKNEVAGTATGAIEASDLVEGFVGSRAWERESLQHGFPAVVKSRRDQNSI